MGKKETKGFQGKTDVEKDKRFGGGKAYRPILGVYWKDGGKVVNQRRRIKNMKL